MVDPPLGYLSVWCDGSISEIKIEVQKMLIIEIGGSRIIVTVQVAGSSLGVGSF
jgi:hypothetical protein